VRPIQEGDVVTISMNRNDCFDFQTRPTIHGVKVVSVPSDTGDIWYFQKDAVTFAVNPMSSDFVGLVLEKKSAIPF